MLWGCSGLGDGEARMAGRGENVSAPFLRVLIICECTDPIPHTHSPSKRRAIHISWSSSGCPSWRTSLSTTAFYDFG